ncbi:MAG: glycosyltransferase family 4 protein [Bacteroidia bacterium]
MKVIQICHKPLFGPPDGGKIAMKAMAEGLNLNGVEVEQWMIETANHPIPEQIPADYPFYWRSANINTEISFFPALKSLLQGKSYNLSRFEDNRYHRLLLNYLQFNEADVIQGEGIYTLSRMQEIRKVNKAKIILRAHNIEYLIWQRMASGEKNVLKKAYLKILAKQLKAEEERIWKSVDGIIAISQQDAEVIQKAGVKCRVEVIGIATDLHKTAIPKNLEIKDLFHLGAMDWRPNLEGLEWFIKDIWPKVKTEFPSLRLSIAGKGMPSYLTKMQSNAIDVVQVEDAYDFYMQHGIMIVPLLSGSGIRVKIIEGMALGKIVISTTIGAEGIHAENGKHFFLADDLESFLVIIRKLLSKPSYVNEVSENARTFVFENYRTEVLGATTLEFYREVITL